MSEHPLETAYRAFSPTSAARTERSHKVFPGGDTRSSAHYEPYPLVIAEAQGCRMQDVDGNEVLDFMNNFTSLIHGHAHADVVAAIQAQAARGTAYAAPNDDQIALAELICDRVASVEQMRFTSSGTEGTQMAIRCARAATGRQKIMKMEGGYHGSYELAEVSLVPRPNEAGPESAPASLAVDGSFPDSVLKDTVICPYNKVDYARELFQQHGGELAGVIVEPVLGSMGMVSADRDMLVMLREETERLGIPLIFDEVITLRLSEGGAQALVEVEPDLTCMGKIIGGGLPVGAIGGRRELMQLFSPQQDVPVMHASTFSGNALTMAAGLAAMRAYDGREAERLNGLGERFRKGANEAFAKAGVKAVAQGAGSLSNILFSQAPTTNARETVSAMVEAGHIARLFHLTMLRHGVMSASRLMYCVSTAMSEAEIDMAVEAVGSTVDELLPYIRSERPGLLR